MAHWLCAIAEVVFNIETGHQLAHVFPPDSLSEEDLTDVAWHAFPDSLSMELYSRSSVRDSSFSFRLRRRVPPGAGNPPFLYGHVFCRQRQDPRLRRGCEQKSIVLLSFLPLDSVLDPLARLAGAAALSYGPEAMREVFEEVQRWPPPEWGCRMTLPLLHMGVVTAELPLLTTLPSSALPAAVEAALAQQQVQQQEREVDEQQQQVQQRQEQEVEGGSRLPAGQPPQSPQAAPAVTPAQVAAALADELDDDGLPTCLLPQAFGQQELESSPWGDCDCYTPLRGVLQQLWALWEVLLLGEPLMVVAPTPGSCSGTVSALLSLLSPFPYSADFRPYYTIHDPSFSRLSSGVAPTASNGLPILLGITNMHFLKALPAWPNVLSTGHTEATLLPSSSSEHLDEAGGGAGAASSPPGGNHMQTSASTGSMSSASSSSMAGGGPGGGGRGSSGRLGMLWRRPAGPSSLLSQPADQCWLGYKPCSRPDKQVLERLVAPQPSDPADKWRRLAAINSAILRRHFQSLTRAVLAPLLPYITPCLPPPLTDLAGGAAGAAAPDPPPLPQLDAQELLSRLCGKGALLPEVLLARFGSQRGLLQFYERFLRSPNLAAWLHLRQLAAEEWQRQEWAAAAAAAQAPMLEMLSIEAFVRIEKQLASLKQQQQQQHLQAGGDSGRSGSGEGGSQADDGGNGAADATQLQEQLQLAFRELPEDLQQTILQTPSHAALLGPSFAAAAAGAQQQQHTPRQPECAVPAPEAT